MLKDFFFYILLKLDTYFYLNFDKRDFHSKNNFFAPYRLLIDFDRRINRKIYSRTPIVC